MLLNAVKLDKIFNFLNIFIGVSTFAGKYKFMQILTTQTSSGMHIYIYTIYY